MTRARRFVAVFAVVAMPGVLSACFPPTPADGVMSGRIVASAGGPALAGIEVLAATESGVPIPGKTDVTDAAGRFEIPGLFTPDGLSAFVVGAPTGREDGYIAHLPPGPSQVMPTWVEANNFNAIDLGDIVLDPARPSDGVLQGRIMRSDSTGPAGGVIVQATTETGDLIPGKTDVTDAAGEFEIIGLLGADRWGAYVFGGQAGAESGYIQGRPPIQFSQVEPSFGPTATFPAIALGDILVDPAS